MLKAPARLVLYSIPSDSLDSTDCASTGAVSHGFCRPPSGTHESVKSDRDPREPLAIDQPTNSTQTPSSHSNYEAQGIRVPLVPVSYSCNHCCTGGPETSQRDAFGGRKECPFCLRGQVDPPFGETDSAEPCLPCSDFWPCAPCSADRPCPSIRDTGRQIHWPTAADTDNSSERTDSARRSPDRLLSRNWRPATEFPCP